MILLYVQTECMCVCLQLEKNQVNINKIHLCRVAKDMNSCSVLYELIESLEKQIC